MLRSVYTKTLRDMRRGVFGWGVGLGLLSIIYAFSWAKAYPDEASRVQLANQIHGGLSAVQAFYGPAINVDQLGGFIEWRLLGIVPVLLGLYLILAVTGMTRGAEESGVMETVAATATTRGHVARQQIAAAATGTVVAAALLGVLMMGSGMFIGEPLPSVVRVAEESANVAVAVLFFGALGFVAAQLFRRRRTAAAAAIAVMVFLHLLNTIPLAAKGIEGVRYASPLYLYTRSSPLANGHVDWAAMGALLGISVLVAMTALYASSHRDLFDTFHLRSGARGPRAARAGRVQPGAARSRLFLANSVGRGVRDGLGSAVGWAIVISLTAVLLTALTPNLRQAALEQSSGSTARIVGTTEREILSAILGFLVPPLIAVFAVTFGASRAGDELQQRLELELCTPIPRWRSFLGQYTASVICLAGVAVTVMLCVVAAVEVASLDVPAGAVAGAGWTLIVLAACVAAFAFAIAGWKPEVTVVAAGLFVALSYFAGVVIPLLGVPDWARYVSVFALYGTPVADGVGYVRVAALLVLTAAFVAVGALGFERRDVAK